MENALLDTLPVCQDFNRSMCSRLNCRFVHLMESDKVEVCDQRVAVCRDHANGQCKRKQCKYYHIPIVLPPANVMATLFKAQQSQLPSNNNSNNNNNNINTNNNINSNDSKIQQATVATDSLSSSAAAAAAAAATAVSTTSTAAAAAATSAAACLLVSETPTTTYSYSEYSSMPRQPVAHSANSSSINNGNFTLTSNASTTSDINSNCIPAMTPAACGGNVCTATTSLATLNPYGNMNMNLSTIGNMSAAKFPKIATTSN